MHKLRRNCICNQGLALFLEWLMSAQACQCFPNLSRIGIAHLSDLHSTPIGFLVISARTNNAPVTPALAIMSALGAPAQSRMLSLGHERSRSGMRHRLWYLPPLRNCIAHVPATATSLTAILVILPLPTMPATNAKSSLHMLGHQRIRANA